jgi:hypothetical protein
VIWFSRTDIWLVVGNGVVKTGHRICPAKRGVRARRRVYIGGRNLTKGRGQVYVSLKRTARTTGFTAPSLVAAALLGSAGAHLKRGYMIVECVAENTGHLFLDR